VTFCGIGLLPPTGSPHEIFFAILLKRFHKYVH
jgi:hypothetical protein